ncbi:DUF3037 domain-containing protein [Stenotrophomonas sp.]|uniref:DUF3037 domain-containing protein n=1 Tax=Stenotrophomonas sp. TaxID=69392 RepID=UPI00289F722F|nr:DUF3037 domain-containing protein [Stenotrophomonas sp.]
MKKKIACQYAIVRFLPYAETGEFANVGVVLACPDQGYLGTAFVPLQRTRRITDFFDGIEVRIYREAVKYLVKDVERLVEMVEKRKVPAAVAFAEITRPREALMTFSAPRVILGEDPATILQALYRRFVDRDFATKEYHEQLLNKGVSRLLATASLKPYFDHLAVGDDTFNVKFPFVSTSPDVPRVVIKPLHLAQDEPNKILDHGGYWVARVGRLKKHGRFPAHVLFAINEAIDGKKKRTAAKEIADELRGLGAEVVPVTDNAAILQFADLARPKEH